MGIMNAINDSWVIRVVQNFRKIVNDTTIEKLPKVLAEKEIYFNQENSSHSMKDFQIGNVWFTVKTIDLCKQLIELKPYLKTA